MCCSMFTPAWVCSDSVFVHYLNVHQVLFLVFRVCTRLIGMNPGTDKVGNFNLISVAEVTDALLQSQARESRQSSATATDWLRKEPSKDSESMILAGRFTRAGSQSRMLNNIASRTVVMYLMQVSSQCLYLRSSMVCLLHDSAIIERTGQWTGTMQCFLRGFCRPSVLYRH